MDRKQKRALDNWIQKEDIDPYPDFTDEAMEEIQKDLHKDWLEEQEYLKEVSDTIIFIKSATKTISDVREKISEARAIGEDEMEGLLVKLIEEIDYLQSYVGDVFDRCFPSEPPNLP